MTGRMPVLQKPRSSQMRFTPQCRGQILQVRNMSIARSIRSASSPHWFSVTYLAGFFFDILVDPE
jgi:hypothetical protein